MFDINEPAVFHTSPHAGMAGSDHRVWLRRRLRSGTFKPAVFILHNPSVANATKNDPTATRGVGFSIAWDCSDLIFVNAATAIATKATELDPDNLNCPMSDWAIAQAAQLCTDNNGHLVAAWGAPKGKAQVKRQMAARFREIESVLYGSLSALRVTSSGWPEHPLYLPSILTPEPYA